MKNISYVFSESDVKTVIFSLSILPTLELEETDAQASINLSCCCSAAEKLANQRSDITPNEFRVIYTSLLAVQLINRGELDVDSDTKKECSGYLFSVNKLLAALSPQFE